MVPPRRVLLSPPDYFDVVDEKNVHMRGQIGNVNKDMARAQWEQLHAVCLQLAEDQVLEEVAVVAATAGCEDMVFCANPVLPWRDDQGTLKAVLSRMQHASRQAEVPVFESFFEERGYEILSLSSGIFEGMGDCILHPSEPILFGGYGFRTTPDVYQELAKLLGAKVVPLEMINPSFYHLDTCLLPANDRVCLIPDKAFSTESLGRLQSVFEEVITVPDEEAMRLSLNTMLVFGAVPTALVPTKCPQTAAVLKELGFQVIEVDVSEFLKSGGSIFCMKLMFW